MGTRFYSNGEIVNSTSNKSNNIVHHDTTVETKLDELDGKIVEVTDAWNSTKAYSVNDYALYNDILYKCILAHSNIVPTNTTYWKPCTIGSEFSQLNNDLSGFMFRKNPTTNKAEKSLDGGLTWENFSGGGADLLWTNPSPTSNFNAQTVSLDLSDYDYVLIESKRGLNDTVKSISLAQKGTYANIAANTNTSMSGAQYPCGRTVYASNTGVQFSNGLAYGAQVNYVCIPTRIWGCNIELS